MLLMTIRRDLLLTFRHPADVLNPVFFFILVVALFPIGISPSAEVLQTIAPGVLWVAALLATLLSMEVMFRSDNDDGSLEQMAVSMQPFILLISGKIITHWIMSGLPLVLLSPVLAVMLALNESAIQGVVISLMLGTPTLSLLGAIGAGLTVGLKKGGVLIALLILPLYVPVLILGTTLIQTAALGGDYTAHMLWLGAILALSAGVAPIATGAGVRISLSH
ncbi:MAG TPA: heme exporter protein CcmB [Pseudomonadales bacterium]|nr:heme exporter protein CcmB [Gammaproteobacteria bacterium]MDP6026934.1 heme exporter protein CcmB [Pseudomonadales bacterium]MDP6315718.1 heme exporter protein CcmB [Pseudomonadales bacterium]MDP7315856.1 heme exporter protein CcmB [Pseudomonadales bacterium]HJL60891.1 heme exporter protein CcmB [Pseudomonadales bacterium]